jgi:hypothetical protein
MLKRSVVIHPFLLAVYPVLFLYSHNPGQVDFRETIAPFAIILGLTLPAWSILGFVFKNWKKSGIIVSLFLVLFFSYGYFKTFLEGKEAILLMSSAWIMLFIFGSFFTVTSEKNLTKATTILNVVASILITLSVLNIVIHRFSNIGRTNYDNYSISMQMNSQSTTKQQSYPDIYFIILDAYAREDILRSIYNFDNSEFLNFLREKGFYIANRSTSNYCQTGLSVGSCFNLSYLDELVKEIGQNDISHRPLGIIFNQSFVFAYLRKHGYKIVAFASGKSETELKSADVYLKPGKTLSMFHNALKNMTPLPEIMAVIKTHNAFDKYRQSIFYILDNCGKVAGDIQSPKFVFVHIAIPHPPFVFGPNGEARNLEARFDDFDGDWLIKPGRLTLEEYRKYYIDQIIFLNGRMEKVVDDILENSAQPPIIMILGDHGSRSGMVWESVEKTNVRECLSILNAYYLPNNGDKFLYPQITPINSFRVIFSHYFGEQYDLLPDKSYFSGGIYLYKFYDVTEKVQESSQ